MLSDMAQLVACKSNEYYCKLHASDFGVHHTIDAMS